MFGTTYDGNSPSRRGGVLSKRSRGVQDARNRGPTAGGQFVHDPRAIGLLRPCPLDRRAARNRGVKELEVVRSEQNRAVLRQGGDKLQQRPVAVLELVYEDKGVGCADDATDRRALKQPSRAASNSAEI